MQKFFVLSVLLIQLLYYKKIIDINNFYSAVVSIIVVCFFIYATKNYKKKSLIPRLIIILFVSFLLVTTASSILNNYTYQLLPKLTEFLLLSLILLMFLSANQSKNKKILFDQAATVISSGAILFSIIGILQLVNFNIYDFRETLRPGATMNVRNFASEYIALTIPFILFKVLTSQKYFLYLFSTGLFIVLNYILALRTRSGIVISAAVIILILAVSFSIHRKTLKINFTKTYVTFLLILVIFTFAGSKIFSDHERQQLTETIITTVDVTEQSNIARFHYIKSTFEMLDNIAIGNGAGTWYSNFRKFNRYIVSDEYIKNNTDINPHNLFLEIYSDAGMAGVLILLLFLGYLVRCSFIRTDKNIIDLIVFAVIISGIFFFCVSFAYKNLPFLILFAFAAAFTISSGNSKKVFFGKTTYVLIITLSLGVAAINLLRFYSEYNYLKALEQKSENKHTEAVERFEKIITPVYPVDPNQVPALHYHAAELIQLERFDEAKEKLNEAIRIQPYFAGLWNNYGAVLYNLREKSSAVQEFEKTKSTFRNYFEPQINLLIIYYNENETLKAKELLARLSLNIELVKKASNYDNYIKVKNALNE